MDRELELDLRYVTTLTRTFVEDLELDLVRKYVTTLASAPLEDRELDLVRRYVTTLAPAAENAGRVAVNVLLNVVPPTASLEKKNLRLGG